MKILPWKLLWVFVGVSAVALSGCGDSAQSAVDASLSDGNVSDAGDDVDSDPVDPLPDAAGEVETANYASIIASMVITAGDVGFDLDGAADPAGPGQVDNVIGANILVRALLNSELADDIDEGLIRVMVEVQDVNEDLSDDTDVVTAFLGIVDPDQNHTNDLNGAGSFYTAPEWVDESGNPRAFAASQLSGGELSGSSDLIELEIASFGGLVRIREGQIRGPVERTINGIQTPDGETMLIGGAVDPCALSLASSPLGENVLHVLVDNLSFNPDIDSDGDGLETYEADDTGITACIDGDGTRYETANCACLVNFVDGFSVALEVTLVGATNLGLQ